MIRSLVSFLLFYSGPNQNKSPRVLEYFAVDRPSEKVKIKFLTV